MSAPETELTECRRVICRQLLRAEFAGWTTGARDGIWLEVRPDAAPGKRVTVHSFHVHPEVQAEPEAVCFTLSLPPSTNKWWYPFILKGVPMMGKSKAAKEWTAEARQILGLRRFVPFRGDVQVYIKLYQNTNKSQWRDGDNVLKGTMDCMNGIVYADDRQAILQTVRIIKPPECANDKAIKEARAQWRARVEVMVSAMKGEE